MVTSLVTSPNVQRLSPDQIIFVDTKRIMSLLSSSVSSQDVVLRLSDQTLEISTVGDMLMPA